MEAAVLENNKTVADYLQLPEGSPCQLLNGELIMSPAPKRGHQKISGAIYRLISNLCFEKKCGEVYYAPFDVYLNDKNVVQPDICFFASNRLSILSDRGAEGAPDLVVELLSPSNAYYDLRYKLDLYEQVGVSEYFIVDPEDNKVVAYRRVENSFKEQYREKSIIRSTLLGADLQW